MYINLPQNSVNRSVKIVRTNLLANNRELHKFAATNSHYEKKMIISDMHHRIMYMYISFNKIELVDQSKPCTQIYLQIIASCINLQLQ